MQEWDPKAGDELGNGRDEAIAESFPASDPPAEDHDGDGGKPRTYVDKGDVAVGIKTSDAVAVQLERRRDGRARPRPGGDRGDHQLHQHLQPLA